MTEHVDQPDPARPLDARLARALVRPLEDTAARPNHLTTLRLALGLILCASKNYEKDSSLVYQRGSVNK